MIFKHTAVVNWLRTCSLSHVISICIINPSLPTVYSNLSLTSVYLPYTSYKENCSWKPFKKFGSQKRCYHILSDYKLTQCAEIIWMCQTHWTANQTFYPCLVWKRSVKKCSSFRKPDWLHCICLEAYATAKYILEKNWFKFLSFLSYNILSMHLLSVYEWSTNLISFDYNQFW